MISEEEKLAAVKMFCAYCRRTLRNARTDIIRKQAREARWETVFSDMHESELNRLPHPMTSYRRRSCSRWSVGRSW
mgnify:CR=1 FL=1